MLNTIQVSSHVITSQLLDKKPVHVWCTDKVWSIISYITNVILSSWFSGDSSWKPVPNLVDQLYKPLEPKVYPIMCYNGAPMLSRNGIYFSKAVRSYGNILLWGIVVVSVVQGPFIIILWHLGGRYSLGDSNTETDARYTVHTQARVHASRPGCIHSGNDAEVQYMPRRYVQTHHNTYA